MKKTAIDWRRWFGARFRLWLGLFLGLVALILAVRAIDFAGLIDVLSRTRLLFVVLTLLASLLTPLIKTQRWRWLYYPHSPRLGTLQLADLLVIGQAVNFLIPGRWGELVRMVLAGEETGISKAFTLGTLAAEKLIDVVVLAVLLVILTPLIALPAWLAARLEPVLVLALLLSVAAVILLGGRSLVVRVLDWMLAHWPRPAGAPLPHWLSFGRDRLLAALEGLAALGQPAVLLPIWGWTVVFWLVAGLTNFILFLAFDLPPSALAALFVLVVLQAGVAVPSTPGKIGVFHYLSMLSLSVFGVSAEVGLAYGLALHVVVIGGITVWAALALWRRSWGIRRLADASRRWRQGLEADDKA